MFGTQHATNVMRHIVETLIGGPSRCQVFSMFIQRIAGHGVNLYETYSRWSGRDNDCTFLVQRLGLGPDNIADEAFALPSQTAPINIDIVIVLS